ncbi:hypothetical protein Poli38472_007087 [Pythium oligandrum]|uniref:MSP domain-containing protein n=1 Tax=Pythium oligandrum TaxID=41045 RepID=A0A8K1C9B3_PYTOL|nr:hypothetical protein Poli38472_007087 [Pythium oligandrum]|eukprot:TMW58942.1 hypothetical protein Poli38472_007087 [Pythium oligandrum]
MIEVEYDGRPDGMTFLLGDRKLQHVLIRNDSRTAMYKLQCTSSRKFRVRPTAGIMKSGETTCVQVQLSPQEREASECKFLLTVREVQMDEQNKSMEENDAVLKALWKQAEVRNYESLVYSETISVTIVAEPNVTQPVTRSHVAAVQPSSENGKIPNEATAPFTKIEQLSSSTTMADRAQFVALLMKNQSRHPQNRLRDDELLRLRHFRDKNPEEWRRFNRFHESGDSGARESADPVFLVLLLEIIQHHPTTSSTSELLTLESTQRTQQAKQQINTPFATRSMSAYIDDVVLPQSYLAGLQPAGAFLNEQSMSSPPMQTQYRPTAPAIAPAGQALQPPTLCEKKGAEAAAAFLTAIRRGLDSFLDDDEEEEDEEDDDYYYQPAYNQYHAPSSLFPAQQAASSLFQSQPARMEEDDLIFPMEL